MMEFMVNHNVTPPQHVSSIRESFLEGIAHVPCRFIMGQNWLIQQPEMPDANRWMICSINAPRSYFGGVVEPS